MINFANKIEQDGAVIGYGDHQKAGMVYLLPDNISILKDAEENHLFSLCLYASEYKVGGRLSLQLSINYQNLPDTLFLPIEQAWLRLRLIKISEDIEMENVSITEWIEINVYENKIKGIALELDKNSALLLRDLLQTENSVVETLKADIKLKFSGLRKTFPTTCVFSPNQLHKSLCRQIEMFQNERLKEDEEPIDIYLYKIHPTAARQIINQWIVSQQTSLFRVQGSTLSMQEVENELQERIYKRIFVNISENKVTLAPLSSWKGLPRHENSDEIIESVKLSWNFMIPETGEQFWISEWNFSDFWKGLSIEEQNKLFTSIPLPEPLKPFPIYITNNVRFDMGQIRKIIVKLHFYGSSMDWETHEIIFDKMEQISDIQWTILPLGENFLYYYGLSAYFSSPEDGGWPPRPIIVDMTESSNHYLSLTPALFQLTFLEVQVLPDAFENIGLVEVQFSYQLPDSLGNEINNEQPINIKSLFLDRTGTEKQQLVKKGQTALYNYYRILVHPPDQAGDSIETIGWQELEQERLLITAFSTQVVKPDLIRLQMEPTANFAPIVILVWLKKLDEPENNEGELIKLDLAEPEAQWAIWRNNLFEKLSYQWRAEIYFSQDSNSSSSLIRVDWQVSKDEQLIFNKIPEVT